MSKLLYNINRIIITFCDNYTLADAENKGRQGLRNIGTFKGYYITNGYAKEITWQKDKRESKTIYKYNDGTSDRYHTGFIAQDVESALNLAEISTKDFAGLVIDNMGTFSTYCIVSMCYILFYITGSTKQHFFNNILSQFFIICDSNSYRYI